IPPTKLAVPLILEYVGASTHKEINDLPPDGLIIVNLSGGNLRFNST
ncbi:unnamed protein product, partial [marine sediment metagenome]